MLFPIHAAGKYGYINAQGRVVVEPGFDYATAFSDGFGMVRDGNRELFLDEAGKTVLECLYEWVGEVSEGLFTVTSDLGTGKQGVMNLRGEIVAPEKFDHVYAFIRGCAVVENDGKAGVIDRQGEWILKPDEFDYLRGPDENGLLAACRENRWGYVALSGEVVVPLEFDRTFMGTEGLLRVIRRKQTGFMSKSAEWAIAPKFANAESFSGGFAVAQEIPRLFGFIDHRGQWLTNERYLGAKDFVGGVAPVVPFCNERVAKWGFIDLNAKMVIPARFLGAEPFHGPLACVTLDHEADVDLYGYIDQSGDLVWEGRRRVLIDDISGERLPF